ncbi:MAG: hypothetical protein ACRCWC_04210 [Plesiomonas shigelloides]
MLGERYLIGLGIVGLAVAGLLWLAETAWDAHNAALIEQGRAEERAVWEAKEKAAQEAHAKAVEKVLQDHAEDKKNHEQAMRAARNELKKATQSLAACAIDADALRLLNQAAAAQ